MKHKAHYILYLKTILFSLIIFFVDLVIIKSKRNINLGFSKIHLVIRGNGTQQILNSTFNIEPYEVYVNGAKDDKCSKTCNLKENKNNIILVFQEQITSCLEMFRGSINIIEIDFSEFYFSLVKNIFRMFRS